MEPAFAKRQLMIHRAIIFCAASVMVGLSGLASATQAIDRAADEELRTRVQTALDSDPYFYAKHVTVTVEKGDVLLKGFVSSDWDLTDAIRIARKAAGGNRVIDDLSIEVGGVAR
jgi:osmotically-inducible protein OsmY